MSLSTEEQRQGLEQCENCGQAFDATRHRWRCPWCGLKANCCEGAPQ